MSKKTGYLVGVLLTIIIGAILYWFFCCKPCLEVESTAIETDNLEIVEPEVKIATRNAFSVIDSKSNLKFDANDNFNFKVSNHSILEPISNQLKTQVERLSTYFNENTGKSIDITGYYTGDENNTSAFPNLGLARANAVKNYFVSQGMSSKAMNTFGKQDDSFVPDDSNIYYGPFTYNINTKGANDTSGADELKALRTDIKANPLVLYFETASASINLSTEQREKVAKIVRYIDKADNALVKTIGHTDNSGKRSTNVGLGLERAEFAKNYLVSNGISAINIKTSSKGPDEPIADNNTEEGKAKNRRVVITLN